MNENRPKAHVCFVCDLIFDSLEEFRSHIVTTHEEGTDYILCPNADCNIPVRELKVHFALKHPEFTIPAGYPTRPIIIRDAKIKKRNKKKVKAFKTGYFYSKKNNKNLFFRSGFESEFYKILEHKKDVTRYSAEPCEIEYFYEGCKHRYIPDIFVEYNDGKKELWEIKPKSQTKLPKNVAKWQAANEFCKKRNWDFVVLTEKGLKLLKKNGKI
jgi:hypothetical protein